MSRLACGLALATACLAVAASAPATPSSRLAIGDTAAVAQVRVPVLMYHYVRVNPVASDTTGFRLSVTPRDFAAQMALLRAEGFHTVSLSDVRRAFDGGTPLPSRPVVLTFDDGYADFATAALPVLQHNGFTATSFVVSGWVGHSGYLTRQQLLQAVAAGMTIGSHTVDHAQLTALSPSQVWWELTSSRTQLRQLSGQPVDDFAYPYGDTSTAIAAQVAEAGYADAVTVASGSLLQSAQRYLLPRVHVDGGESLDAFARSVGLAGVPAATSLLPSVWRDGYTILARDGAAYPLGDAPVGTSVAALPLAAPVVGGWPAVSGYWAVAADGGVFALDGAPFYGSLGATRLNAPVVGMVATPSGRGYWLVAADGGVFTFGDAPFFGSMGSLRLNAPVVGMAATPTGQGYWLVGADGGVFTFGDAPFLGSMGSLQLNAPVVAIAWGLSGQGYWLAAADGGVFTFGDAHFLGSMGSRRLEAPVVAAARSHSGDGYWLLGADGGVFTFGDAWFAGTTTRPL